MRKVCIVDDTESVRKTVHFLLKDEYEVLQADGGTQLFELLKTQKPDIIFLDIMMPDANGTVVKTKLKGHDEYKDIPIVFLTAVDDQNVRAVSSIQAEDYIVKPFTKNDLLQAIKRVLKEE